MMKSRRSPHTWPLKVFVLARATSAALIPFILRPPSPTVCCLARQTQTALAGNQRQADVIWSHREGRAAPARFRTVQADRRDLPFCAQSLRSPRAREPPSDSVHRLADLRAILPQADFIALTCPLTKETEKVIDADAFSRMKTSAYLISAARGRCVDEPALIKALQD